MAEQGVPDERALAAAADALGTGGLIDFEWSELRHLAWDVAHLMAPWPTCWCAWRIPEELSDGAVKHYRQLLGDRLPTYEPMPSSPTSSWRCWGGVA